MPFAAFLSGGSTATKAMGGVLAALLGGAVAAIYHAVFFTTPQGYVSLIERSGKLRRDKDGNAIVRTAGRNRRIPLLDKQRLINIQEYLVPIPQFVVDRPTYPGSREPGTLVNCVVSGEIKFRPLEGPANYERLLYGGEGNIEQDVAARARAALKSTLKATPFSSSLTDDLDALLQEVNERCGQQLEDGRGVALTAVLLGDDSRSPAEVMASAIASRSDRDVVAFPLPTAS